MASVDFLLALATTLELPFHSTTATALKYWFLHKQFASTDATANELDDHLMLCTCIHLACKQTEVSRKLRDVVNAGYWILHHKVSDGYLDTDDDVYWNLKESLVSAELLLLRILGFETTVETPHPWIVFILQEVWTQMSRQTAVQGSIAVDARYTRIAETAIAVANDSFLTAETCLGGSAQATAAACVFLASRAHGLLEEWVTIKELSSIVGVSESDIGSALEGLADVISTEPSDGKE
ncbi:Cyclin- protein fam58a [Podochytrium sp. JEL0797]|nr:Cyclin- protein fam58a [Podochytrium sp. JEL0797]